MPHNCNILCFVLDIFSVYLDTERRAVFFPCIAGSQMLILKRLLLRFCYAFGSSYQLRIIFDLENLATGFRRSPWFRRHHFAFDSRCNYRCCCQSIFSASTRNQKVVGILEYRKCRLDDGGNRSRFWDSFFLQALNHSFSKTALFLLSGNIIQATGTKRLADIKGILKTSPTWEFCLLLELCRLLVLRPSALLLVNG